MQKTLSLPPNKDNPRNSEGAFIQRKDDRILFVYTHFTGGDDDDATAYLAGRFSDDGGLAWTAEDITVLANDAGQNIMSASLLRLNRGDIALFYLVKNSPTDCRPHMRISTDEAQTWGPAVACVDEPGYYVLNNDRAVQLQEGRLVLPVALHNKPGWTGWDDGTALCLLSDDNGKTWRQSRTLLQGYNADNKRIIVEEPGLVALNDGRLMMFCRTNAGCQYVSYSADQGETWTPLVPSGILSPRSPASIKRIPATGDLLMAWNDHRDVAADLRWKRTPLCAAISRDEGQTWEQRQVLESDPDGWYCYTAIAFVGEHVLLGYCAGDRRRNNGLAETQVTRIGLDWLYARPGA